MTLARFIGAAVVIGFVIICVAIAANTAGYEHKFNASKNDILREVKALRAEVKALGCTQ